MSWDWEYSSELIGPLLKGLEVTVKVTLLGMIVALVLGMALALGRRSGHAWLSRAILWFVELVRSTPLLILVYALFYILPEAEVTLSAWLVGILGLGIYYSSYTSEVLRAGIDNVPRGQWEAAKVLGIPTSRVWRHVILPQAIPAVVPALGNQLVAMFKDSAVLSTITVIELLAAAQNEASLTYRYVEPLTIAAIFYFVISYASSLAIGRLEVSLGRRG